jgi:coenzyme F420-reducing hydrogenase alpha subunit
LDYLNNARMIMEKIIVQNPKENNDLLSDYKEIANRATEFAQLLEKRIEQMAPVIENHRVMVALINALTGSRVMTSDGQERYSDSLRKHLDSLEYKSMSKKAETSSNVFKFEDTSNLVSDDGYVSQTVTVEALLDMIQAAKYHRDQEVRLDFKVNH